MRRGIPWTQRREKEKCRAMRDTGGFRDMDAMVWGPICFISDSGELLLVAHHIKSKLAYQFVR